MEVPQISEEEMAEVKKDVSTSGRSSRLDSESSRVVGKVITAKKKKPDIFHALLTPLGLLRGPFPRATGFKLITGLSSIRA